MECYFAFRARWHLKLEKKWGTHRTPNRKVVNERFSTLDSESEHMTFVGLLLAAQIIRPSSFFF